MNTDAAIQALADPELFERDPKNVKEALVKEFGPEQTKNLLKLVKDKRNKT